MFSAKMLRRVFGKPFVRAVGAVSLANLLFFVLMLVGQGDREVIKTRVRNAFATGDLGTVDFVRDPRRGWDQYGDSCVLQMLTNQSSSRIADALAPKVYFSNMGGESQCGVLRALVVDGKDPDEFSLLRYGRYWQGDNVIASFGLRMMELRSFRRVLSGSVWLAIALLAVVAFRSGRHTRRAALMISFSAATVWGVPYFSTGLTHGADDALLLMVFASIAAWPGKFTNPGFVIPFAAAFGATVMFLANVTGQFPIAAAWLAVLVLAAARDETRQVNVGSRVVALTAVAAFVLGGAATIVMKQILAVGFVEKEVTTGFLTQLVRYTKLPESLGNIPGFLVPYYKLVQCAKMLTYGSVWAGYLLVGTMTVLWFAAAIRGWCGRKSEDGRDVLMLVALALIPVAWVSVLPNHTAIHPTFMVRILIIPISLAPLALWWPRSRSPAGDSRDA